MSWDTHNTTLLLHLYIAINNYVETESAEDLHMHLGLESYLNVIFSYLITSIMLT